MDDEDVVLGVGKAEAGDADDHEEYAAILWIPDPTERRGWRDMWIAKKKDEKPKHFGYGR